MTARLVKFSSAIFVIALLFASLASGQSSRSSSNASGPCPRFNISSSAPTAEVGSTVVFEIASSDPNILSKKFKWTLSRGKIVSGQGTSRIEVQALRYPIVEKPSAQDPKLPPGFTRLQYPTSILISGRDMFPRAIRLTASASLSGVSSKCRAASITIQLHQNVEINQPADVVGLKLSTETLVTPCKPGVMPREGTATSDSMIIDVKVEAVDKESDVLGYNYEVSGGRIQGTGSNVKWDLTGVAAGSYTITAAVDDGCGLCGKSKTRQITIGECEPACALIDCPSISITGPDRLADVSEFTANVSGGSVSEITYEWTVTNGVIVEGQGTPTVKAKLEATSSITIKIGGLEGGGCITSASKEFSGGIVKP